MVIRDELGRARWSRRRWQVAAILAAAWAVLVTAVLALVNPQLVAERDAWAARAVAAEAALAGGKPAPAPVTPEQPNAYNF